MAVSFTRFAWCLWAGKDKEPISNGSSLNSSFECGGFGMNQPETVQLFPSVRGNKKKIASSTRKAKRKWQSREERRMERRDCDFVMVSSDGGCSSGSESDGFDMSIGWIEPHDPGFQTGINNDDNGFAVLVPCYSPGCKELVVGSNSDILKAFKNLPIEFSPDCKNYMEQVLSSALVPTRN